MREIRVAVAQIHAKVGKIEENLSRIRQQVLIAGAAKADALLLPETCIHAYDMCPENLALAFTPDHHALTSLRQWSYDNKLVIMAGFIEKNGEKYYNSHYLAFPDGRVVVERKCNITDPEKAAGITPGERRRKIFIINNITCALLICADSGMEGIFPELEELGVELRFHPTAGGGTRQEMLTIAELTSPESEEKYQKDRERVFDIRAFNRDNRPHAFASANAVGDDGHLAVHRGHCMIVDRDGVMRAQIPGTNILEHHCDQIISTVLSFPKKGC